MGTPRSIETQPLRLDDLSCQLDKSSRLEFGYFFFQDTFPPFLCFFLGPVVGAAASQPGPAPPLLFPFCCTLSSTFPLKLPCTPLHPSYLAISLQPAKLELDFHLSSEIALYSPPSLVLGHFSAASQAGAGLDGSLEGVWRELELHTYCLKGTKLN